MKWLTFTLALALQAQIPSGGTVNSAGTLTTTATTAPPPPASFTLLSVSPQQATVLLTCANTSAATISVVDNSGLLGGGSVPDTDPTLFTNANVDLDRTNTILSNSNLTRQIELGFRAAQLDLNGNMTSRSLQTNTAHTATGTCSGGSPQTLNFTTLNLPVGNTSPQPAPFNSSGFGNLATPDVQWSSLSSAYVDPQTGVILKPAAGFGRFGLWMLNQLGLTAFDPNSTWTNLSNILSGTTGTLATVTASTNPVYVSINNTPLQAQAGRDASGFSSSLAISDLRINVCGDGDQAAAGDRQVDITLYTHTGTPVGNTISVTLPQTTPSCQTSSSQSSWPAAPFGAWGTIPQHNMVFPWTANVSSAAGAVTNNGTAPNNVGIFNTDLASGDKLWDSTGSTLYTFSSLTDALHLNLVESPTFTGHTLIAANFGFYIQKHTATGTVHVSVFYDDAYDSWGAPGESSDGASSNCSSNTYTISVDASGNPATGRTARNCIIYGITGKSIHALFEDNGEVRQIGQIQINASGPFNLTGYPNMPANPWDPTDPQTFYLIGNRSADGFQGFSKGVYTGDGRAFTPAYHADFAAVTTSDGHATCPGGTNQSGNICFSLVTSSTMRSVCNGLDSRFGSPTAIFGQNTQLSTIAGNQAVTVWLPGGQDGIGGLCTMSLSTGAAVKTWDSFASPGTHWGVIHTIDGRNTANYVASTINIPGRNSSGGNYLGPWSSTIVRVCRSTPGVPTTIGCFGGTWDSNSAITSNGSNNDSYTCPSAVCGGTVTGTVLININQQPESPYAATNESTTYPCSVNPSATCSQIGSLAVGDTLTFNGAPLGNEIFTVLAIQVVSSTDIYIWVKRGTVQGITSNWPNQHEVDAAMPNAGPGVCAGAMWWFDTSGTDTTVRSDDCNIVTGAHNDARGVAATAGSYSATGSSNQKANRTSNAAGFGTAANLAVNNYSSWQGANSCIGGGLVEEYPSLAQLVAPSTEKVWYADFRSYQGGVFNGDNAGTENTGTTTTHITGNLYRISTMCNNNIKLNPWEAWAGRFIMQDVSGPSSTIGGSDTYKYCYVYKAGECTGGSTAGQIYFALPFTTVESNCWTNQYDSQIPCVVPASPIGDWALQWDITQADLVGSNFRRLTKGFSSVSRMFTAWNWRSAPDAGWGWIPATFASGQFPMLYVAKLPPWPGYDSVTRSSYVNVPITAASGALVEIRFGYEENGATNGFDCTSRGEACATIASPTSTNPFNYITADGHSGISCGGGCTVNVPGISGRMLWYQQFTSTDGGATWNGVGSPQQTPVP